MDSEDIRFYYKCTVFESISQCCSVNDSILKFADEFREKEQWHDYVTSTVFSGNLNFIKYVVEKPTYIWNDEENLWLLRSINRQCPDLVTQTLRPYCLKNYADDVKIYNCLCHDVSNDSDEMYDLRLQLLNHNPSILKDCWHNFYNTFKESPLRCIEYLKLLTDNYQEDFPNIHFPDAKILKKFGKTIAIDIVDELLPVLLTATKDLLTDIDTLYGKTYDKWVDKHYNNGFLRKIVLITKWAMEEVGEKMPESIIKIIATTDCSSSLIGNEILLAGIRKMPLKYADFIINWLQEDFPNHIFDYTGNPNNFLANVKPILQRFSPACSKQVFENIENIFLTWHDSTQKMLQMYLYRLETNKDKSWRPVYHAYWGHMQKELLPSLDNNRLSKQSKELIQVLNRNDWITEKHYHASFFFDGRAKNVVSPVDGYAERLSDKTWIKIISTPAEKMSGHYFKETKSAYLEANHFSFANALAGVAKKQPNRIVALLLKLPNDCYPGYISNVIYALKNVSETDVELDMPLIHNLIKKYWHIESREIRCSICELIKSRSNDNWPNEVLEILKTLALEPQEQFKEFEKEKDSARALHLTALNTPRGSALYAIAALLFQHHELGSLFKDTISSASCDSEDSVRFATVACAIAYYNIDPNYGTSLFKLLLEHDLRILVAHGAWELLYRDFPNDMAFYREKLIVACSTDMYDLQKEASCFICALAIFYNDSILQNYLLQTQHTEDMVNSICRQAAYSFDMEDYRDLSKFILLFMAESYDMHITALGPNFFKEKTSLPRDTEFLLKLLNSKSGIKSHRAFLSYLSESEEDIIDFAEILQTIGQHISDSKTDYHQSAAIDDIIQCTIQLFDNGKEEPKVRDICLDIWDELFRNNMHDIKPLADMIDNFI